MKTMSTSELSKITGVPPSTIKRWLHGDILSAKYFSFFNKQKLNHCICRFIWEEKHIKIVKIFRELRSYGFNKGDLRQIARMLEFTQYNEKICEIALYLKNTRYFVQLSIRKGSLEIVFKNPK